MSCILVICLLGAGGMFPGAQSIDSILQINKKYIAEDDPAFSEGDIFTPETYAKFSPKLLTWRRVGDDVVIPYKLSHNYNELHRKVIFEAFGDLKASTCITFVERTTQRDYIDILPGNGCYSSVGCVGRRQVVSLAFECLQRGKGVVLHELMHVMGFWHEHSRADRDDYVIIHWEAIIPGFFANFCKYDTTNMLVKYDYGSILHYSRLAFSESGAVTIEARDSRARTGQRIKLSESDILRVNKLYFCPQYVFSNDYNEDVKMFNNAATGIADCPDINQKPASISATVAAPLSLKEVQNFVPWSPTKEPVISPISVYSSSPEYRAGVAFTFLSEEHKFEPVAGLSSVSPPPTEEPGIGPISISSSSPESKPGSVSTFPSEEHKFEPGAGLSSVSSTPTKEPRIGPISASSSSPESKPGSESTFSSQEQKFKPAAGLSSVSPPPTEEPGISLISISSSSPKTKPGSVSTFSSQDQTFTTVVYSVGPSVTNLKLNTSNSTKTVSTIEEGLVTEAILQTSISMSKSTTANVDMPEKNTTSQSSTGTQSGEMQQQTLFKETWISSGLGEDLNASHNKNYELIKENLHLVVEKRSLVGKTLDTWYEHHPRRIHGNKLTNSYSKRRKSWKDIKPFCGFEYGFCGWQQSTEDDLDWRLSWGSLNVNTGRFRPEGFHLSLKSSPEDASSGQKALLLRPVVQPSNCISFWYSSRHRTMGTLNVYISSSGMEEKLLWSYGGQDHVKWTKAQIMLPSYLLDGNAHVVVEGVMALSGSSNIAIDDLYVGQC